VQPPEPPESSAERRIYEIKLRDLSLERVHAPCVQNSSPVTDGSFPVILSCSRPNSCLLFPNMEKSAYTVGWICALSLEASVAVGMLDEFYDGPPLPQDDRDHNNYTLGRIGPHNIVIACLPEGTIGVTSAALVAAQMRWTFPSLRIGLMVGIGGGVPSEEHNIRLGDVVVSRPTGQFGGVIQYDFGKTLSGGRFERIGSLNKPPTALMTAVSAVKIRHEVREPKFLGYLSDMATKNPRLSRYTVSPGKDKDQLFRADYEHPAEEATCAKCRTDLLVAWPRQGEHRPPGDCPVVHYGLIASGNQVMKNGVVREQLRKELNILCFEMEAAGLMDEFPCVVIRGICDYADSHKHKEWQPYAAATAAAYAKELLMAIPPSAVAKEAEISTIIANMSTKVNETSTKVNEIATAIRSERSVQLLDRLSPVNFWDKQQDVHIRAQKGTGTWVLDDPTFKSWLNARNRVLWCRGIPGAGKTVLTSIIINHLMKSFENQNVGVAWIYLNYREKDLQTIENLFASLLRQLIQQGGSVTEAMITSIGVSWREGKPNLTAYKNMLQKALHQYSKTFIVIDALNESRSQDLRKNLVSELRSLRPAISLLITSQPLRDIHEILGDACQIEILARNEDVKKYLDSYMQADANLRKLVAADPNVQSVIRDFITRSDDGM
jgi:nucleoside phosphorylase